MSQAFWEKRDIEGQLSLKTGSSEKRLLFSQVTNIKRLQQYLPSFIYYSYLFYSRKDMKQLKATLGFKKKKNLMYTLLKSNERKTTAHKKCPEEKKNIKNVLIHFQKISRVSRQCVQSPRVKVSRKRQGLFLPRLGSHITPNRQGHLSTSLSSIYPSVVWGLPLIPSLTNYTEEAVINI